MVKRLPTRWETWAQSLGWEDLLEKEMGTHSSILAWKIPWMEEPVRLQSMGLQRIGHDWVTSLRCYFWIWEEVWVSGRKHVLSGNILWRNLEALPYSNSVWGFLVIVWASLVAQMVIIYKIKGWGGERRKADLIWIDSNSALKYGRFILYQYLLGKHLTQYWLLTTCQFSFCGFFCC